MLFISLNRYVNVLHTSLQFDFVAQTYLDQLLIESVFNPETTPKIVLDSKQELASGINALSNFMAYEFSSIKDLV